MTDEDEPTERAHASAVRRANPIEANVTVRLGAATPTQPKPPPAERFEDLGEIARGGMSSVRKVFDHLVLREVAMKVLEPTRNFDELAHFIEEAQITGQLDHPNIVPVHDMEMDEQGLPTRFTMKLVRGKTLAALIDESGDPPLPAAKLEQLLQVFLRVCDAVAFAHSRGVIHRDLKPQNVMVGAYGQVYLMDWGVALLREGPRVSDNAKLPRVHRSGDTLPEAFGSLAGTPLYMAPEQALGQVAHIDERTDIYGLGGMLYQLLTRRAPHEAPSLEESLRLARAGAVRAPSDWLPNALLPPLLCQIAQKALATRREDRYANVAELQRDVEAFVRGGGWFAQRRFEAGTPIVVEGDSADAAYIITEGECELYKFIDGAQRLSAQLKAGEVFGETAIFGSTTRTATIVAKTAVTALVVTREALERELSRNEWLGAFVHALAKRFVDLDRQVSKRPSQSG